MSENETKNSILSENTPIRIGLILMLLGLFGSGIWWASSTTAKLDSILSFQKATDTTMIELKAKDIALEKELNDSRLRFALVEVDIRTIKEKLSLVK